MDVVIYTLCALTSAACAFLLFRAYSQTQTSLTFWSGLCFTGLTASNVLLVVDRLILPEVDLYTWRLVAALAGLLVLVYTLVWERD